MYTFVFSIALCHFHHHLLTITIGTKLQVAFHSPSSQQRATTNFMLRLITQFSLILSRHELQCLVSMRSKVRISDRFVNEKLLSVFACRLLMANAVYSELMKNFSHFHENKFLWLGKVFATFARSEMSALKTKKIIMKTFAIKLLKDYYEILYAMQKKRVIYTVGKLRKQRRRKYDIT